MFHIFHNVVTENILRWVKACWLSYPPQCKFSAALYSLDTTQISPKTYVHILDFANVEPQETIFLFRQLIYEIFSHQMRTSKSES